MDGWATQSRGFRYQSQIWLFSGNALAATLDTTEASLNDKGLAYVNRIWPICDAANAQVQVGYRDRIADSVVFTNPVGISSTTGSAGVRATGMYHRARVTIPASTVWTTAQGVKFDARPAGRR